MPMTPKKASGMPVGSLVFFAVYALSVAWMYVASTPEISGRFSEREERDFRVAAVKTGRASGPREYVTYSLARLRQPGTDLSQLSFLLPERAFEIPGGDLHRLTVLESGPDWQLVQYEYGNTHSSLSRYRAYKGRVEPVSFRITFHPGIVIWGFILLVPALVAGAAARWIHERGRTALSARHKA